MRLRGMLICFESPCLLCMNVLRVVSFPLITSIRQLQRGKRPLPPPPAPPRFRLSATHCRGTGPAAGIPGRGGKCSSPVPKLGALSRVQCMKFVAIVRPASISWVSPIIYQQICFHSSTDADNQIKMATLQHVNKNKGKKESEEGSFSYSPLGTLPYQKKHHTRGGEKKGFRFGNIPFRFQ